MQLWKWFLVIFGIGLFLGVLFGDASVLLWVAALAGMALAVGIVGWELKQISREWRWIFLEDRVEVAIWIGSTVLLCSVAALTIGGLLTLLVGR